MKYPVTHPALSEVPQSFPRTSSPIFQRNLQFSSPWQRTPCEILRTMSYAGFPVRPSVLSVNRSAQRSPLSASASPLIGRHLARVQRWSTQHRHRWQSGTFPPIPNSPSTSSALENSEELKELWCWLAQNKINESEMKHLEAWRHQPLNNNPNPGHWMILPCSYIIDVLYTVPFSFYLLMTTDTEKKVGFWISWNSTTSKTNTDFIRDLISIFCLHPIKGFAGDNKLLILKRA